MNQDAEHLHLLSLFHYVVALILLLCGFFPIFHVAIGAAMLFQPAWSPFPMPAAATTGPDPRFIGAMFFGIGLLFMFMAWTQAVCITVAGRFLAQRRHRTFCLIIAGFACMFMPFGTVLGVFTIVVLLRPSVQTLFDPPPHV